jgi:hypothetical protein
MPQSSYDGVRLTSLLLPNVFLHVPQILGGAKSRRRVNNELRRPTDWIVKVTSPVTAVVSIGRCNTI